MTQKSLSNLTLIMLMGSLIILPQIGAAWDPPREVSLQEVQSTTDEVMAMPRIPITTREDIFSIEAVGLNWDIGVMVYEPQDASRIPVSPDGKKLGIFLLHGGTGDWRSLDEAAHIAAERFGYRVVSMTFPGRLNLEDASRDWPRDTVNPDGTFRTPIWQRGEIITSDQYQVITDNENTQFSGGANFGTSYFLAARKGSRFYDRMAGWPVAFEEGMKTAMARHFPVDEYSVFIHGHSTGGPFVHYISQRVENIRGIIGYGTALFGYMNAAAGSSWEYPFNYLRMRTWRDTARYADEGFAGKNYTLPQKMEIVLASWDRAKVQANFKAEDFVHKNSIESLSEAARVTGRRMELGEEETQELVDRYIGYTRELRGPRIKPVPPVLHLHGKNDTTVTYDRFTDYGKALYEAMVPPPKANAVLLGAGVHSWGHKDEDIPHGIAPMVVHLWDEAIRGGYFFEP
jgi:acetyl esterase/lipase